MEKPENWTEEELRASVVAYVDMHRKQSDGVSFVKSKYYTDLNEKFGRSKKAYEYRMQNISYIYSLMGREWIVGCRPKKNVGTAVAEIIEGLIADVEGQKFLSITAFEVEVATQKSSPSLKIPAGIKAPSKLSAVITTFVRDPKVKAWILKEANGICECCSKPAPFKTFDGEPYLEVHHIRRLADNGSDTVSNAIALCPNCHRELHYGSESLNLIKSLYEKLSRLIIE